MPLVRPEASQGSLSEETAADFLAKAHTILVALTANGFEAAALRLLADDLGNPSDRTILFEETSGCESSEGGKEDADDDGVPRGPVTTTYDCRSIQADTLYAETGTEILQDRDDATVLGGMSLKVEGHEVRRETVRSDVKVADHTRVDLEFSVRKQDKMLMSDHGLRYIRESKGTGEAKREGAYFVRATWQAASFFEQDLASLERGTLSFGGFITLEDGQLEHTLSVNSSPLALDRTKCAGSPIPYTEGTVTFADGAGKLLVLTYRDCLESASFDGVDITAKIATARGLSSP